MDYFHIAGFNLLVYYDIQFTVKSLFCCILKKGIQIRTPLMYFSTIYITYISANS